MSTALVSAFYDVGDVLCQSQNRKIMNHYGKMSVGLDRKAVGAPVNSFPRARGFSTSAIQSSPTSSGKISPASSWSSSGSIGSYTMPPLNVNEMMMHRDLGLSKKIDRSLSVNDATDIRNRDNQRNNNINSSRYKTELCRPFEENGHCKYGDKCQFAHGMHELRNLARHPKYKTELCRTYHTVGFCPYGPRCHFIHNEDERKLNQINDLKQPAPMGPPMPCMQALLGQDLSNMHNLQLNPCFHHPTSLNLPQQVSQRPRAIAYNQMSLSLGSTADSSPPSSMSGSPTSSPTFLEDYRQRSSSTMMNAKYSTSIPTSAPGTPNNVFNFANITNELTTIYAPLDVQTTQQLSASASHGVYILNQRNNQDSVFRDDVFSANSPPSPPDSLSGDSVSSLPSSCSSPRNLAAIRLPIFRRISVDDQ